MSAHVSFLGRIGSAAALATLLIGCAPSAEDGNEKGGPAAAPAGETPKGSVVTQAQAQGAPAVESLAHAQLTVPADWTKKTVGPWMVFTSADGVSHIAVGPLESNDVTTTKVQEAAAAMGAASVVTVEEQATTFGPDKLPARAADGTCKIGAADIRMGYVVVDLGGGNRAMAVHAAAKDLNDAQLEAGRKTIASLRRR